MPKIDVTRLRAEGELLKQHLRSQIEAELRESEFKRIDFLTDDEVFAELGLDSQATDLESHVRLVVTHPKVTITGIDIERPSPPQIATQNRNLTHRNKVQGRIKLAASGGAKADPALQEGVAFEVIQKFATLDVDAGRIVFFDDGMAVFIELPPGAIADILQLDAASFALKVCEQAVHQLLVDGLTPTEALRFVLTYKREPKQHSITWA